MVKLVGNRALEWERRRVKELEAKIIQLEAEIRKFKGLYEPRFRQSYEGPTKKRPGADVEWLTSTSSGKPYQASTAASRRQISRITPSLDASDASNMASDSPAEIILVSGTKIRVREGTLKPCLSVNPSTKRPNFENATKASLARSRPIIADIDEKIEEEPGRRSVGSSVRSSLLYSSTGRPPSVFLPPVFQGETPLQQSLVKTFELDLDWFCSYGAKMYIPSKAGFRLLRRAHCLAQEAFFNFARARWPRLWHASFIEGPHEVLFGREETQRYFNRIEHIGHSSGDEPAQVPYGVRDAVWSMAHLRNSVSHFGSGRHYSIKDYDFYIECAQKLAVAVEDEPRVRRLLGLRRELRKIAEEQLAEIERLEPWLVLPFARSVPVHHERLFQIVLLRYRERESLAGWSPAVVRTALAWGLGHERAGEIWLR